MTSVPANLESKDLGAWMKYLVATPIPVLKVTAREVARIQEDEDNISPRIVATTVLNDPMMTFKVLSYAQKNKGRSQQHDLTQVEQAIIMMGMGTFFNRVKPAPLVENMLKTNLVALTHLLKLIKRAHRAANYAVKWAEHLMDLRPEEVLIATLLHDLSEMLMWCHAPDKMIAIFQLQQADKNMRSKAAQQEVFGFNFHEMQKEVVEAFQLPPLLLKLIQDEVSQDQRVRNVRLAVDLARHSANGWDDAALPDDYQGISELLRLDVSKVKRILGVPEPDVSASA